MKTINALGLSAITTLGLLGFLAGSGNAADEEAQLDGVEEAHLDGVEGAPSGGVEEVQLGSVEDAQVGGVEDAQPDRATEASSELAQAQLAAASPIELMSINVRIPIDGGDNTWANRLLRIRDTIKYYRSGLGPHIVGAQELRSATYTDLHNALGNYWAYWVDRGDGERIVMWVDTSRFAVENWNSRIVTNGQRDDSCGLTDDEGSENRAIQYVQVRDLQTNRVFTVYNTHYPSHNSCERYGMSTIFSNYIYQTAVGEVMLMGDFNDGINTDGSYNGSFSQLLADQGGMLSAYDAVNSVSSSARKLTGHGYNKTARTGKMIDHIVVDSWIGVQASEVSHLMYTGSPGVRVPCSVVNFNPAGTPSCGSPFSQYNPSTLKMYSDHWAVWARITP